ncbi:hypothetical protein AGMMS49543_22830 [Betaproteobacteria bacterium]|nr:hypothetical protein AGMMS49543_22830 [Betaproteobacteria bacterium]GHU20251.1 hypothetical protein AGMMS50243_14330 [Betaproteobacteria bacterium]
MKQARQACKPARHPLALAVASALALVSLPAAAQTSQWQLGSHPIATTDTHINSTQINFGGHEWVVIGNDTKDIYQGTITGGVNFSGAYGNTAVHQPLGSVTLLLSSSNGGTGYEAGNGFGTSAYRSDACGTTPGDCKAGKPNEYNGSTLQGAMDAIAGGLDKEQDVINARTLLPMTPELPNPSDWDADKENDGINGYAAPGQLHWALSFAEWEAIGNNDIRKYPSSWWLRSPDHSDSLALAG